MKKALKIIAIIVVVIFLLLLILPFVFKGKIVELVKQQANENLRAKVEFNDVSLSLIRNFPNLAVSIEDLSVVGVEEFDGDTLARIADFAVVMDVMSVINGDEIVVKSIHIDQPYVMVKVLEDGTANYDIAIASEDTIAQDESTSESGPLNLSINEYSISNGVIIYDDATFPMRMVIDDLDHVGNGDFAQEVFTLSTETHIKAFTLDYDGIKYASELKADLMADLAMNFETMRFEFMENELDVNALVLNFDGFLEMPSDDIVMDISFDTEQAQLTSVMSLIPAYFAQDMDGVNATGNVILDGYVRGTYNDESMPGFMAELKVDNGSVQYPDLPKSIQNIAIDAKVESPEGNDMDKITVDVPKFHMEIGKTAGEPNTVDAYLYLRNPMSDPNIRTKVDADLNLGSFKDVVPMEEDFEMAGNLSAHFKLDGNLSAIENQQFNDFEASGAASMNDFIYSDASVDVALPIAKVDFTPQRLNVETVKLIYEEINMEMDGYVSNYVTYALKDTTLQGVFNFAADKIDVNKFMTSEEGAETAEVEEEVEGETTTADTSSGVVPIPANLDLVLNATIGEITYDDLILTDLKGKVTLRNERAELENLTATGLGGTMGISGSYSTQDMEKPAYDFAYDINGIEIDQAFATFNTVKKIAPIAEHAKGKISSDLNVKGLLDQKMEPIYETMQGRGTLQSDNLVLEGGPFLEKLSNTLKAPSLARQSIQDLDATFVIENGKVTTEPFDIKIDAMTANVSGWVSFEEKIDYLMKMKIPRKELGGEFNDFAEGMLSQANAFLGGNMSLGEFIKMNVSIEGSLYDPSIRPEFAGMDGEGSVTDQAKEAAKEVIDEQIDKAKEDLSEKADEILADAQKQADKLVQEAQKAGDRLRSEADKQEKKLEDAAKNPLAKAGAKIAADKTREEADKKANDLVKEAQKQADKIMADARKEADKIND
ncbi:MAG TPA: AsmA-like C-terminal region-containing protein [Cryomorphaceae bacterium]|nr:AsmA-like C-terminal region-containing protein [Cryomorphaceae bacterium]